MKKLLLLFLAFPLLLTGCQLRDPLYNLATTGPDDVPRIISFDPADNLYDVPRNALIGMLFSKPMDQQSLEDNFRYSYSGQQYDSSDGSFLWDSANRLAIFRPFNFFPSFAEVTVTVGFYVQSKDGFNLDESYEWRFGTSSFSDFGPLYNITSFWASEEIAVAGIHTLDAQIILEFDKEMLRSSVEGSFQLISDDFQDIRTVNDGYFLWSEPALGVKRAIFSPNEPLMSDKQYNIYLNANGIKAVDVAGNSHNGLMPSPLFQFQTIDAIYVSISRGIDSNQGYIPDVPVKTVNRAMELAVEHGLSLIKIAEGIYNEDIVVSDPNYNGLGIQGGWIDDFTAHDPDYPYNYETTINTVSRNYVIALTGVDGVFLESIFVIGQVTAPPDINGAVLIDGGSTNIRVDNCFLIGSEGAEESHGVRITGNSNNVVVSSSRIRGANLSGTNRGHGISINNAWDINVRDNYELYGGGGAFYNAAIHIDGSVDNVRIERNLIEGGWEGELYGIYIGSGAQNIVVQDNSSINGGATVDNDTYGILVENGAVVNIYRNTIIGGEETGGVPNTHIGVGFSAAGDCNLFNNFIVGGAATTDTQNDSYGVYVLNCDVDIINNTIDGLGFVGAPAITTGIYGENTNSNIINNIIIGGRGGGRYGITLSSYNTLINDVLIFFNTFDRDGCLNGFLNDGSSPYFTIATMETGYNTGIRSPSNNLDYLPGEIEYNNPNIGDFWVDTTLPLPQSSNPALIQNNGYDLSLIIPGELADATLDRFYTLRPVTSMDRGGHEFNP
jgi:hypothetical protein